ncbi:SecB-like chaperone [Mycobacteroides abscessus]|uniref:SecB-like chaperone SecBL n=1 Tax=Mycobacteroides abscessus TaxID=36809 RepID=UPI0018779706|nr:SecB chaperone [Mycobacteroides abscessus]MBE5458331.1 SecB-like chaperone [Mycobacteroides abscessus]
MTDAEDIDLQIAAARVAARSQIRDIRLLRTEAAVHSAPDPSRGLTYDLEFEPEVDADPENTSAFVVRIACRLSINNLADTDDTAAPSDEMDDEPVATADFEYAALFDYHIHEEEDPPAEEELAAYATTTGRFALYPYIREYIYDLTGRLALPPLTIEVLFRPLPPPPGQTSTLN